MKFRICLLSGVTPLNIINYSDPLDFDGLICF